MKRRTFSLALMGSMIAAGITMSACNGKSDDTTTSGDSVVEATLEACDTCTQPDKVNAVGFNSKGDEVVLATSPFADGKFSLTLPSDGGEIGLIKVSYIFAESTTPVTISDTSASVSSQVNFVGLKDGKTLDDELLYAGVSLNIIKMQMVLCYGMYMYIDKDCTAKGTLTEADKDDESTTEEGESDDDAEEEDVVTTTSVDITFKKGWNIMYMTMTMSINAAQETTLLAQSMTTTIPSGVTMKWYYSADAMMASLMSQFGASAKLPRVVKPVPFR